MLSEGGEHGALMIMGKVREAVPGKQAIKASIQLQRSHVTDCGRLLRSVDLK